MAWVMNIDNFRSEYTGSRVIDGGGNGTIYELPNSNKVMKISTVVYLHLNDHRYESVYDKCLNEYRYKAVANLMATKEDHPEIPIANIYDVFFVHSPNQGLYPHRIFSGEGNASARWPSKDGYMYIVTVMEKLFPLPNQEGNYIEEVTQSLQECHITPSDATPMIRQLGGDIKELVLVDYDDWLVPSIGEL